MLPSWQTYLGYLMVMILELREGAAGTTLCSGGQGGHLARECQVLGLSR